MSRPRRIALLAGCPAGVGPEVLARAVAEASLDDEPELFFVGPKALLLRGASLAGVTAKEHDEEVELAGRFFARRVRCTEAPPLPSLPTPGAPDEAALVFQREALLLAIEAARAGEVSALVTGPVRKRALVVEGKQYPGQTELLSARLKRDDDPPLMCFWGGPFALGLCTVHLPLREVATAMTEARVESALRRLFEAAAALFCVERPRLCALGLNPHAGEGGLFGDEEARLIAPVLERLRKEGIDVEGPWPADGFFASVRRRSAEKMPHGVLAMFHDQGLGPYKILAEGRGVNLTWGLPVPRTSPDHGTADDVAGKGKADASSMTAALALAARLVSGR